MNKTRRIALYIYLVLEYWLAVELGTWQIRLSSEAWCDLILNLSCFSGLLPTYLFLIKSLQKKLSVEIIVLGTALLEVPLLQAGLALG